ncbi:MAG TPA: ATP-binding cassette domain-containing protein [Candidatus Krumholzibacteria bacterium]|nr:ATP-binding cassette domain-containing protein [Candidatus Krumholzibacteria bacterium]
MPHTALRFRNVTFAHAHAAAPLLQDLTLHLDCGWTGVVGPNGVGKTTLLRLAVGELEPASGQVLRPEPALCCPQRTDDPPHGLADLLAALDGDAFRLRDRLGVEDDWLDRWPTLSHGERKRAQVAVALWREPLVLALDEPTNHLDRGARAMLRDALTAYRGVGLLVSHDRELLDDLCARCLFLDEGGAVLRPGGYGEGAVQAAQDAETAVQQRTKAKRELADLTREAGRRRDEAQQADGKRSKRGLARKDSDGRAAIDAARVSGKDGAAGRRLDQLSGRLAQAQQRLDQARVTKTYATGIWMAGAVSSRNTLLDVAAADLDLGGRTLHVPPLTLRPTDRVALTGPNGGGKSTLLARLRPAVALPPERVVWVPQEIPLAESRTVLARARALPHDELGRVLTVVSRLGSRPERLLETDAPSPGEVRKILLALGIAAEPHLIVMDEPTNHLDLVSIECLEAALADCPCALLLVSHDRRFLEALTTTAWRIEPDGGGMRLSVES